MKGTKFLSELITDPQMLRAGKVNIIDANTSAGKTYFALTALPKWAGSPEKVLYLIDTGNGEMRLQQNILAISRQDYAFADYASGKMWGEFADMAKDKMPVMTYAGFGSEVRQSRFPFWEKFDYIVCDEFHNLINYEKMPGGKENLQKAERTLHNIAIEGKTKIVALTATPSKVRERCGKFCYDVPFDRSELRQYETFETITYTGTESILLQHLNQTGILYTRTIEDMKKYIEFARYNGLRANGFWSLKSNTLMTDEQLALRDRVLIEEVFPEELDLLVINASSETCIKIQNIPRKVDYMIVNDSTEETQIQVRGRYCGDLDKLYLHEDAAKPVVPPQFLNKPLFSVDKDRLCIILNLRSKSNRLYKWNTVHKKLEEAGYSISESRKNNQRFSIIREKENASLCRN